MKKILAIALAVAMVLALAACGGSAAPAAPAATEGAAAPAATQAPAASAEGKTVIEAWSFTEETLTMMDAYLERNPEIAAKYEINKTYINGAADYQTALDPALQNGAVDYYGAEADYIYKYVNGDASSFAAAYEDLGIDVNAGIEAAQLAPYTVEIGTRKEDGKVVGLGYQATGGAFIYRRSIAKAVWGSDDPAVVGEKIGAGTNSWDSFFAAAEEVKAAGYKMVSGTGDVWNVLKNAAETGWVVDGKLNIDPMRESYLDIAKTLKDNGYMNDTSAWTEGWYADMKMDANVLGFYGPAWLLNYTMSQNSGVGTDNSSVGDWAVTSPNVGFFWGGTWLMVSKTAAADPAKAEFLKGFIEWVTLDCTEDGLQYAWANGLMNDAGTKDVVASETVMKVSNGESDFLAGQNQFEYFIPANAFATGKSMTNYDSTCNDAWGAVVGQYAAGECDRDTAISTFKMDLSGKLDIEIDF